MMFLGCWLCSFDARWQICSCSVGPSHDPSQMLMAKAHSCLGAVT